MARHIGISIPTSQLMREQHGLAVNYDLQGVRLRRRHDTLRVFQNDCFNSVALAVISLLHDAFIQISPQYENFPRDVIVPPSRQECLQAVGRVDIEALSVAIAASQVEERDILVAQLDDLRNNINYSPTARYAILQSIISSLRVKPREQVTLDSFSDEPLPFITMDQFQNGAIGSVRTRIPFNIPDTAECRYRFLDGAMLCYTRRTIFDHCGLSFIEVTLPDIEWPGVDDDEPDPLVEVVVDRARYLQAAAACARPVADVINDFADGQRPAPHLELDPVGFIRHFWRADYNSLGPDDKRSYEFWTEDARLLWGRTSKIRRSNVGKSVMAAMQAGTGLLSDIVPRAAQTFFGNDHIDSQYAIAGRLLAMKGQFVLEGERLMNRVQN